MKIDSVEAGLCSDQISVVIYPRRTITSQGSRRWLISCRLWGVSGFEFHQFLSLERLSRVSEDEFRKAGFDREKYITGTVSALQSSQVVVMNGLCLYANWNFKMRLLLCVHCMGLV